MLKYSLKLLIFLAIVLLLSSCAGAGKVKVGLDEEFSLSVGQTALITGENLQIRFEEVTEDSRCPKNATCIWEGRVSCAVEISDNNSPHRMTLAQPGLTDQYTIETYEDYQLTFKVEPYPEVGREIPPNEYRLLLIVSK